MRWTPTIDPITAEVAGLSFEMGGAGRATLELEYLGARRMRLVHAGTPALWARVEEGYRGVWLVRPDTNTSLGLLPPIRAQEARALSSGLDWMKWVATALASGEAPALRPGTWQLTELRPAAPTLVDRVRDHLPDVFASRDPEGQPARAYGLASALTLPRAHYESWWFSGSSAVLPLRGPSDPDAARVKSWRKHARAGTLPPIVLWWVSAFDMHVVLDGHDRLQAAQAEGVRPWALTLWQAFEQPADLTEGWRHEVARKYERAFQAGPLLSLRSRRTLNDSLVNAYRAYRYAKTRARGRHDLTAEWMAEVEAELADDPELARRVCGR